MSVDPLTASAPKSIPQSFNRYSYTLNNPLRYVDPSGLSDQDPVDYRPEFRSCIVGVETACDETQTVLLVVSLDSS